MHERLFSFWFVGDMMWYEINPGMRFYDGWKMKDDPAGNNEDMHNSYPHEMKRTMRVKDSLGITICWRYDNMEYSKWVLSTG